jgi:heme oxygenase
MALLRHETQSQHGSLERKLPWQEICSDQHRYVDLLARFYGFYSVWEPMAESRLRQETNDFMQPRRKRSLLRNDLHWFGWRDRDFTGLPKVPPECLYWDGQAMILGSYYVLEGSTLGGQILSRQLERQLGLKNGDGYSYFCSYGSRVRDAWNQFGNFLSAQLASEADMSAAVAGAKTTFEVLEAWLTGR